MTTQYYSGPNYFGRFVGFVLALVLGATGFAIFVRHAPAGRLGHLATAIVGRATTLNASVPEVVAKVQRLSRLETAVYSVDTVVETSRPPVSQPDAPGWDRILLVVHGESTAGIDLGQLKPEDVRIDAGTRSIHVTLPASQLFTTTVDSQHARVYVRSTGLLVPAEQDLEADPRVKAQDQLQHAALADGILDSASKNARATVTALLYALGFERVDVS
ncbi:MAG: DUF4230 domain-containing protein [Acidobacteriaceae bacterium]|jgi:hypothetical protein